MVDFLTLISKGPGCDAGSEDEDNTEEGRAREKLSPDYTAWCLTSSRLCVM